MQLLASEYYRAILQNLRDYEETRARSSKPGAFD